MILLGAGFNWHENVHRDWMLTHRLFLDELINNPKLFKRSNSSKTSSFNRNQTINDNEADITKTKTFRNNTLVSKNTISTERASIKETNTNNNIPMIANNKSSEIFIKIILSDEYKIKPDISNYLMKSSMVLDNIKEKMMIDSIVRPLKIFWIKADYGLVGRIVAFMGTGLAMISSNIIKSTDFSKFI